MKMLACCMLMLALCMAVGSVPANAQSAAHERYPLSIEAVTRALHLDGLDVQAADLHMPMSLSTAVSNPSLELVGTDRMPDGHLRLRLHCRRAGDCLPFSLTLAHSSGSVQLKAAVDAKAAAGEKLAAPAPLAASSDAATSTTTVLETAVSVHAGAHLTMLMEDGHMHIHLPVVSLSSATRDGEVRVATLDGKHTYRAMVVNEATVRGIME